MAMPNRISKLVLTGHVTSSVGWLGAVAVFIALATTALSTDSIQVARATYIAMDVSTRYVIVPFCFASLATGMLQALGTRWGLFKHYWIVVKLVLTVAMTAFLVLHMGPIGQLEGLALEQSQRTAEEASSVINLIKKAAAAFLGLLAVTTISVYKPWGKLTARKPQNSDQRAKKPASFYVLVILIVVIMLLIVSHLTGGTIKH
ncbi:hypothetical protein [Flaviaesturariibacter amylovorans]|uniref:DUF2269 family protein n=1 Tax=Flaviaesturariibacter amylovorans TaxID=1084520 RepID=A0ABP8HAP5_9BACT